MKAVVCVVLLSISSISNAAVTNADSDLHPPVPKALLSVPSFGPSVPDEDAATVTASVGGADENNAVGSLFSMRGAPVGGGFFSVEPAIRDSKGFLGEGLGSAVDVSLEEELGDTPSAAAAPVPSAARRMTSPSKRGRPATDRIQKSPKRYKSASVSSGDSSHSRHRKGKKYVRGGKAHASAAISSDVHERERGKAAKASSSGVSDDVFNPERIARMNRALDIFKGTMRKMGFDIRDNEELKELRTFINKGDFKQLEDIPLPKNVRGMINAAIQVLNGEPASNIKGLIAMVWHFAKTFNQEDGGFRNEGVADPDIINTLKTRMVFALAMCMQDGASACDVAITQHLLRFVIQGYMPRVELDVQ